MFPASAVIFVTIGAGVLVFRDSFRADDALKQSIKKAPEALKEKDVRKSVLDQPSLKEPIHKREGELALFLLARSAKLAHNQLSAKTSPPPG